jgi:hypothetical protein
MQARKFVPQHCTQRVRRCECLACRPNPNHEHSPVNTKLWFQWLESHALGITRWETSKPEALHTHWGWAFNQGVLHSTSITTQSALSESNPMIQSRFVRQLDVYM